MKFDIIYIEKGKEKICSIRAKPQFSTHTHTHTHTGSFCLAFFSIIFAFTTQTFASGISATNGVADPATCDTDTLETSTGPVQLRAQFTPEVINLRWYNDGNQITVPTASNTCTYDTAISLPTNPTKPGYKFKGWRVVSPFDFSTLPTNGTGTEALSKKEHCIAGDLMSTQITQCDSRFNDLQDYEWKAVFSWGTIYGVGMCSSTVGTTEGESRITKPNSATGSYCWCKATGYKGNSNDIRYAPSESLPWVYLSTYSYACDPYCADYCSWRFIRNNFNIVSTMLGH